MESMRGSIAAPEKKVENIHELFNQEESEVNQNVYTNDKDLPKIHQQYKQQYQQQQQQNQQYRSQTPQLPQPPQQQYQQTLSSYFDAVVAYQNAWSDLERAVGVPLRL
jgi:phage-related minor tail protein